MPCCLVPGCNVRGSRKTKTQLELEKFVKISFHRLPRAKSLRNCWLENLNIKNDDGKLTYTVCSLHFDESDFDRTSLSSVRLRDGAIPYVHKKFWTLTDRMNKIMESRITQSNEILNKNNHNESTIECTDILIKERDREHIKNDIKVVVGFDAQSIENIIEHTNEREQIILDTTNLYNQCKIQDDNHKKSVSESIENNEENKMILDTTNVNNECTMQEDNHQTSISENEKVLTPKKLHVSQSTSIALNNPNDTPRKKFLIESLNKLRDRYRIAQSKIKSLQRKNKVLEKRIANLRTVFSELKKKKYLGDNDIQLLKCLSESNAQLLQRQVKQRKDMSTPRKYSPELRSFALTLHYYSPRAYAYVRQTFDSCLPHPKTIYKWYKTVDGEPGFNVESLKA